MNSGPKPLILSILSTKLVIPYNKSYISLVILNGITHLLELCATLYE